MIPWRHSSLSACIARLAPSESLLWTWAQICELHSSPLTQVPPRVWSRFQVEAHRLGQAEGCFAKLGSLEVTLGDLQQALQQLPQEAVSQWRDQDR